MEDPARRGKVWWDGSGWCDQQFHAKEFKRNQGALTEIQNKIRTASLVVQTSCKFHLPVTLPLVKNGRGPDVANYGPPVENPPEPPGDDDSGGEATLS